MKGRFRCETCPLLREKRMQCNNAISECKMMLASIMPSVGIIDEVNNAILPPKSHQLLVLSFILTFGDFHCHTIIHQSLDLTADTTRLTTIAEADIHILR